MDAAPSNVLQALIQYIEFSAADAALLKAIGPVVDPIFPRIVDRFYEAIDRTPEAKAVFAGGAAQMERQKKMLRGWLDGLFGGVYDDAYYERRARIGRTHVRINLDQRFMFAAMNIVRRELHGALRESSWPAAKIPAAITAIDKICDIELAVMLETYREDHTRRTQHNERLATIGQVAASIGHELRNPLAVMQTSVQLLGSRVSDDARAARHLGKLNNQIRLCNAIISDLLELARDRAPDRKVIDLVDVVREAVASVPRAATIAVEVTTPSAITAVHADPVQIRQVVVNLVLNAVQAIGAEGKIILSLEERDLHVALTVDDSGPGLSPDVERHLFQPLFTTRSSGTGLGLALCRRIVEKHGGVIRAQNRDEGGARFIVELPRPIGEYP
ncbi:MAG: protoglobin domain-containing protein [Nannocystaceae bacterium]